MGDFQLKSAIKFDYTISAETLSITLLMSVQFHDHRVGEKRIIELDAVASFLFRNRKKTG